MTLSPSDWHHRFQIQARWTKDLRQHLYKRLDLENTRSILEVGCGTGAVLSELRDLYRGNIYGLDVNIDYLKLAKRISRTSKLINGDAFKLPFETATFDLSTCHYLMLWLADPLQVIIEMVRVTRPGGWILAMAEPDYGGRIDYPYELSQIGFWQAEILTRQGADPQIGRKLSSLYYQAGLEAIESGVLGGQWSGPPAQEELENEWTTILNDLDQLPDIVVNFEELKGLDYSAWESGERILYVPTFYAIGKVPLS
ncbi:MAG: methyltransferase domain-containing protein [Anaerolineales bacterium]|jgi:ubiquinone/menaquinone biosynthesis C-methylase UbiE